MSVFDRQEDAFLWRQANARGTALEIERLIMKAPEGEREETRRFARELDAVERQIFGPLFRGFDGLPPITVQELETLISQCDARSFLGRALDGAVEAFIERRRADVLQAFRDVARVARQWRSVPKAAAPARLWDAAALACWRLYRESAP